MTTDYPAIGSRWKENDQRFDRIVEVVSHSSDALRPIGIVTVSLGGFKPSVRKVTFARAERFGSKRAGCYSRHFAVEQRGGDERSPK